LAYSPYAWPRVNYCTDCYSAGCLDTSTETMHYTVSMYSQLSHLFASPSFWLVMLTCNYARCRSHFAGPTGIAYWVLCLMLWHPCWNYALFYLPPYVLETYFYDSFALKDIFFFPFFLCLFSDSLPTGSSGLPLVYSQSYVLFSNACSLPCLFNVVYSSTLKMTVVSLQNLYISTRRHIFTSQKTVLLKLIEEGLFCNWITTVCFPCVNDIFTFLMLKHWRWFAVCWWDHLLAGTVWVQCWTHLRMKKRNKWGCNANQCWLLQKTSSVIWVSHSWYLIWDSLWAGAQFIFIWNCKCGYMAKTNKSNINIVLELFLFLSYSVIWLTFW
jgi:hypothetical protein